MDTAELSWNELDIERRLGFSSKKYTGVNSALAFLLGALLTLCFYAALYPFFHRGGHEMVDMFFHGGPKNRSVIPYFTVFLAGWSVAILALKRQKLLLQRRALSLDIMPADPGFVLSPDTAAQIIDRIHRQGRRPPQIPPPQPGRALPGQPQEPRPRLRRRREPRRPGRQRRALPRIHLHPRPRLRLGHPRPGLHRHGAGAGPRPSAASARSSPAAPSSPS